MSHALSTGRPAPRARVGLCPWHVRALRAPMTAVRSVLRRWSVAATLFLLGVFVLGATAVRFAPPGSSVAVWWPAAGLAVAFLLATPRAGRPRARLFVVGVLVASGAANAYGGRPPLVAACLGIANAAEVAV